MKHNKFYERLKCVLEKVSGIRGSGNWGTGIEEALRDKGINGIWGNSSVGYRKLTIRQQFILKTCQRFVKSTPSFPLARTPPTAILTPVTPTLFFLCLLRFHRASFEVIGDYKCIRSGKFIFFLDSSPYFFKTG